PTVRDERGIALVLSMFLTLAISVVAASLMFLSQTETYSTMNYRTMSQTRYGAESGIQMATNYLLYTYGATPPSSTNAVDPIAAYDLTQSPVRWNGNPVVLSADTTLANYPAVTVKNNFANAFANALGKLTAGTTTVTLLPTAMLMSMEEVS